MTAIDATDASRGASGSRKRRTPQQLRDRLFRAARRHTIYVKTLRVLLPLTMIGSIGGYALLLKTSYSIGGGTLKPGKIEVTNEDLKMKNPSYFGVTKENGKYTVRAKEAVVDLAMTGPVKLLGIDGDLVQANGVRTLLKSTRGILDNKTGQLELYDGVDVDASNGMRAQLDRAMVYTKEHRVVSKDPIRAQMPTGTLTANAMDFSTDKRAGKFRGNVMLRLTQTPTTTGTRPSIGLGGDARQPVDIQAQEFDIDDAKSLADFRVGVVAKQGETQLTAPELHVTYEGQASAQAGFDGAAPAAPAQAPAAAVAGQPAPANGGAQMSRLVAKTGVVLTAGTDRRVVANEVDFDVKADTALFTGNVELMQAKNVFRGGRLAVDRKAGKSRLDTPATTPKGPVGRIAATLIQTQEPARAAAAKAKAQAAPAEASNPLGGFKSDPNAPTDIEADSLEVNDQTKQATFRGRVVAKQGDYVINTAEMIANYSGQTGLMSGGETAAAPKGPAGASGGLGGAQLTSLNTRGGTKIVSKDGQEAEGANAHFDLKSNQVTMDGPDGVKLGKGNDAKISGARMRMDLTKGEAHIEGPGNGAQAALTEPTAAQRSISAKPGVAPPAQPTTCAGGGQMCAIIYPKQFEQAVKQGQKGDIAGAAASAAGAVTTNAAPPAKPKPAAVPQISPSTVYRAP